MMKKWLTAGALALTATVAQAGTTIEGTGASFPYPVYKEWIGAYYNETGNKVNYTPTGSGAGVKAVTAREVDFGGSDKPLSPKVLKKKKLYQFPSVVGAITLSYNLPGVEQLRLSEVAISGIVLGTIQYWDNPVIAKDNPGVKLPHKKVLFVHRSDKSGTTFNFTYYLSKMSSVWRSHYGAKKLMNWPMENRIGGKGNFGVAAAIKTNPYSIGYVDYADAKKNKLKMAEIEGRDGAFVKPSLETFQAAAKFASLDPKKDFYAIIAYPKKGYPIVAATFVLLPEEKTQTNKQVTQFFDYAYRKGDDAAKKLGYVPLPEEVKAKVRAYWQDKGIY